AGGAERRLEPREASIVEEVGAARTELRVLRREDRGAELAARALGQDAGSGGNLKSEKKACEEKNAAFHRGSNLGRIVRVPLLRASARFSSFGRTPKPLTNPSTTLQEDVQPSAVSVSNAKLF